MIDAMIKSAILFAIVAIVTRLLKRRTPAALRHLLWAFAIVGALAIPLISRVSPLRLAVLPAAARPTANATPQGSSLKSQSLPGSPSAGSAIDPAMIDTVRPENRESARTVPAPGKSPMPWTSVFIGLWALGTAILLARLIAGLVAVRRIASRGHEITDAAWQVHIDRAILASGVRQPVEVVMSGATPVPYTCGLTHPTIVLPSTASEWTAERRDAVLLHELAHISRGDLAMNILSHVTRALYWPNPLAWLAANGLRFEGERACDDAVLRTGARASDYADHLLDIVKSIGRPVPNVALAMARSSDFEGRLLAILEPGVPRTRLGRTRAAGIGTAFAAALLPLSAMTSAPATAGLPPAPVTSAPTAAALPVTPGISAAAAGLKSQAVQQAPVVHAQAPTNTAPLPAASETIAALGEALADANPSVRLAAVNSLGAIQDPAAITALARALKEDTDARVREAAAWALGEIDDNRAVPHLLESLRTERVAKVRVKVVEALREIDDPSALSGVSGALKDASAEVRRAAVSALGEFEDAAAIPALIGLIRDEDVEVRRNGAGARGVWGGGGGGGGGGV
jgi:beta-lactamase regulating signal transducer with metallopeptidase domain